MWPPQRAEGSRPPGREETYRCFYMEFSYFLILFDFGKYWVFLAAPAALYSSIALAIDLALALYSSIYAYCLPL